MSFYVPVEQIEFSALFGSLEKNRRRLNIAEYTIGQGSLTEAFDNILNTRNLREPFTKTKHSNSRAMYRQSQ